MSIILFSLPAFQHGFVLFLNFFFNVHIYKKETHEICFLGIAVLALCAGQKKKKKKSLDKEPLTFYIKSPLLEQCFGIKSGSPIQFSFLRKMYLKILKQGNFRMPIIIMLLSLKTNKSKA